VESTFNIKWREIVALPGVDHYGMLQKGDRLDLHRPDGTVVHTVVGGVEYPPSLIFVGPRPEIVKCGVLLGPELAAADVPQGTEVWAE